jgi:CheY-like chemotaxis protein
VINSPQPIGKLQSLARVLIVDDQAEGTPALEVALDGLPVETAWARSGEEALGFLLKWDFAVMLLDVRMPGMDGFETAQVIRGRARTSTLPIIFVTGFDPRSEVLGRAYALGAVDFITKPVDPGVLRAKVGVFVDLHNAAREVEQARAR